MSEAKPVIYIFRGDDDFGIAKAVEAMVARLGDKSLAELNVSHLDGSATGENDLRTAVTSMPFLADRRLVVLERPLARLNGEKERQRFLDLLGQIPETTALILVVEDHPKKDTWEHFSASHWLVRWSRQDENRKRVLWRDFPLPTPGQMPAWIREKAKQDGGQFTPEASSELAKRIGNDPRVAAQEIVKLLTYADYKRPVEKADVELLTEQVDNPSIFALTDALGNRKGKEAQAVLHELLDDEDALSLFGMIVRQFRQLLLTREIIDQGGGAAQVVDQLQGKHNKVSNSYVADKLVSQARRFSMPALEDIYRQLLAMDEAFKNSQMEPGAAFDVFIAELTA